ncbi:unnamed protein product [Moneuplotes crassus]|uniref:Uncharacterized protein n=1 Tax=Euplotes crassus TaxID=5936 RepID=A0AAD1XKR2_EUPCR|nr:unnamed protein product [Moneuplotes crassus]
MERKEPDERCTAYITMLIIYSLLGFLILLVQVRYLVKYLRIYGIKHKLTSLFMGFLTLSILCDIAFGASQAYFKSFDGCTKYKNSCLNYWSYWINFYMYLNTIIVLSFTYVSQILKLQKRRRRNKTYQIIVWTIMLTILVALAISFLIGGLQTCKKKADNSTKITPSILVLTCSYMLTGGIFVVLLFCFYKALQKLETDTDGVRLSSKIKWRLAISAIVIFIAFEIRGSNIIVRTQYDFFKEWKQDSLTHNKLGYAIYIFCHYLFLSSVPTMIQIYLIKLSLSMTPRISVCLIDNYGQEDFFVSKDFEASESVSFQNYKTIIASAQSNLFYRFRITQFRNFLDITL